MTTIAILLAACATQHKDAIANANAESEGNSQQEVFPLPPLKYDTAAFESRVRDAGGRVDFVFGDARPFPQCHASTVVETPDGQLLCAWFGGTEEKSDDVGIWLSRFEGGAWSNPVEVAKVNETPHWNPVLFRESDGTIDLFFKVGREIPFWTTVWIRSKDGGRSWTKPDELVVADQGGRGPVKNKPIILSDGTWLAPASTEFKGWKAFADRSSDGGITWERSMDFPVDPAVVIGQGVIQPTFWESSPGKVHALLRSTGGSIGRTDSLDYGRTWSPVRLTSLPNPNSGIDALRLDDGRVLLVYNPTTSKSWGRRSPLNLAVSSDNGETWTDLTSLETEPGMEFSYPAIVSTSHGVAVSYTWKRERVRCWQIPLAAL
ncbi:MAG: exo-alpha-sialidase [Candidatus Hydrogenedentes bacterium]|nr:exo-alpha-sialidase [Candidatus Hydrogenedentota bacterium]